jgi:hypothetical protein
VTGRFKRPNPCDNMNHRRPDAPVGHCPQCGGVVNAAIQTRSCSEDTHAAARRQQAVYCVHCGTQLIVRR